MKITKVDDYKFVRDEETGKIVKDKKTQLLKEMKHTDLDTYIRNSIKGKLLKNLKKDKDNNNSEILKGIKKIIRNINIKNKRVKLNENNISNIKNAIKSMKNDTLSYSYIENNIFKNSEGLDGFINFLIEISRIDCRKDTGNKINGDIERTFSDKFKIDEIINLKNIEEDYSNWVKITQKSINNNKIISLDEDKMINNSNEKKASKRALFLEDLFEKLLKGDKSFDNKIEEYEKEYDVDSLITVIKIMDNKEVDFKEEDKKSKIDKVVKYIEENTFFPIIEDELEEEKRSSYLKNCLIKKSLIGYQKNFEKLQDARKNKSGLNYYDEEVIHYFNKYYPVKKNSKSNTFISLEDDIKNDEKFLKKEKIHKEIRYRLKNRAINLCVKKGQLVEYKDTKSRDVIKSQDLELMHIDDVFSRKMSSTISYAANSFKAEMFGDKTSERVQAFLNKEYNIVILDKNSNGKEIYNIGIEDEKKKVTSKIWKEIRGYDNSDFKNKEFAKKNIEIIKKSLKENELEVLESQGMLENEDDVEDNVIEIYKKLVNRIGMLDQKLNQRKKNLLKYEKKKRNYDKEDILLKDEGLDKLLENLEMAKILDKFEIKGIYPFVKQSVFAFRNTSFHYQNINLKFLGDNESINKLKSDIKNRSDIIPKMEIIKAYSNGVFKYFDTNQIFEFFGEHKLYYPKENNKMPSFKNILKSYRNMSKTKCYNVTQKEDYLFLYSLYKLDGSDEERSKKQAKKYLLLKLYNAKYKEILDKVLELSSKYYKKKIVSSTDVGHYNNIKAVIDNKGKYEKMIKFEECKKSDSIESLGNSEKYFWDLKSAIQKDRMLAEIRQKSTGFAFDIERELVAEAFYNIIKNVKEIELNRKVKCEREILLEDISKQFDNIMTKIESNAESIKYEKLREIIESQKIELNPNSKLIYGFYGMALMLSSKKLSELYNNLVSYKQAYQKIGNCSRIRIYEKENEYIDVEDALKVLRILINSQNNNKKYENLRKLEYENILKNFIKFDNFEELFEFKNKQVGNPFYIQEDGKTLIKFKQIIEADREKYLNRYKKYYEDKKIMQSEVDEFCKLKLEIERRNRKQKELKENICKFKNGAENKKEYAENKKEYTENYEKILEYQWLKNRILFNDVSKMNNLLIEIYSKLTGLVAVLEKNAIHILISKGFEIDNTKGVIKNIKEAFGENQSEQSIFGDIVSGKNIETRNKLAHFNYLRDEDGIDFISQLNNIRELLKFDRKLKNAVTKTVIKTFDKYGFELNFEFKEHKIDKYSIKRKGFNDKYMTKNFKINENKDYFLQMIKIIIFDGCKELNNNGR